MSDVVDRIARNLDEIEAAAKAGGPWGDGDDLWDTARVLALTAAVRATMARLDAAERGLRWVESLEAP